MGRFHVVDVGGSIHFWDAIGDLVKPASLTILNVTRDGTVASCAESAAAVELYDGKRLPFEDNSVDLLLCNSVIEHVPLAERAGFAAEIRRVARRYAVQTPAFEFPVEPHLVAPFIHWLPRDIGRALSPLTPRAFASGRPARVVFDEVRLLTRREFGAHFPGAKVATEYFLGMPKSYVAFSGGLDARGADSGVEQ